MNTTDSQCTRVKIYGGCHATVISDFLGYIGFSNTETSTNYQLISEGNPIKPEVFLDQVDLFIFSPVLNKPGFNTEPLEKYAISNGIKTISYPWLQWNGYHPYMSIDRSNNDGLISNYTWYFHRLLRELASEHKTFASFLEAAQSFRPSESAEIHLMQTTEMLRQAELDTDIKVSDFILKHYHNTLLFHWPAHPTNYLYAYFLSELIQLITDLGISLSTRIDIQSYLNKKGEIHPDSSIPILGHVKEDLGLTVGNEIFMFWPLFGKRKFNLEDYFRLHYDPSEFTRLYTT
jgi:hypothetical protein